MNDETERTLLDLEHRFWTDGADFYLAHVDDACTFVFGPMASRVSRADAAEMVANAPRWEPPEIEVLSLFEPAPSVVLFSYSADARREGGASLRVYATSAYVRRDGEWKLTFHQQTPRS